MNKNKIINKILTSFKESGKSEIVIVNIGTDKLIGDVLAPMVGTFLHEEGYIDGIYGTIEKPIHAVNLESQISVINDIHRDAFIIGIDSCLCEDEKEIGKIKFRDLPISPGKGVGKDLMEVGDCSLIGICDVSSYDFVLGTSVRLNTIWNMAKDITDIIEIVFGII